MINQQNKTKKKRDLIENEWIMKLSSFHNNQSMTKLCENKQQQSNTFFLSKKKETV